MKAAGATFILLGTILWVFSHRLEGTQKLTLHKEAIRFLEFARNRIALCGMPLPDILSDYHGRYPKSRILLSSPLLEDYFSGAGESGTEEELRRVDYHLSRLMDALPTMEQELRQKNQLLISLSLPAALIIILLFL